MLRYLSPLFIASALAACSVSNSGPDSSGAGAERGNLGKADAIGSCELPDGTDACGGKGDGSCWCDELCVDYGDCCSDAGAVCEIDDAGDDAEDDGEVCGEVLCALFCENGFQTDENGCEVCACEGQFCGGIAAIQCPPGQVCTGVADFPDAGGTCEPLPFCGGIAGIACPDGLVCVDVPGDGCDPPQGADCGGMCVPPPEPTGPSCEGNCDGPADGGSCWCDEACAGYGDCCDDYAEACTEPDPTGMDCGEEVCAVDEVCVTHVTQLGPVTACEAIDASCEEGEPSCSCMGQDVCTGVFDLCSDNDDGGLSCHCPVC